MINRSKFAVAIAAFALIATPALVSTQSWADGGKSGGYKEGGKTGGAKEGGKTGGAREGGAKSGN